jgi:hypothetical protein
MTHCATPTDWKTESLPAKHTTIPLDRLFSAGEMDRIRCGLVPEAMEDKWFLYCRDDTLYCHRSWTGVCIYVVHFAAEDGSFRMTSADANRDPVQYRETRDERDAALVSYLIDTLLLRRVAEFPSDEADPERRALEAWGLVGRAMLLDGPDEPEPTSPIRSDRA